MPGNYIIYNASGARGLYGEGYPFHKYLKPFGLDYTGSGFITKTVTLNPIKGNLKSFWFPKCIKIYPKKQCVLNAVGLTNPGITGFFNYSNKYFLPDNSILSVGAQSLNLSDQLIELRLLFGYFNFLKYFDKKYKLEKFSNIELNISCPNITKSFNINLKKMLDICPLPTYFKINVNFPKEQLLEIQHHDKLAGITVSNSLPWGDPKINWGALFGTFISPLHYLGGGGLSGRPLFPLMLEYISELRQLGFEKEIMAGGGILTESDISNVLAVGANKIQLGSVSLLRPWRIKNIIKFANSYENI